MSSVLFPADLEEMINKYLFADVIFDNFVTPEGLLSKLIVFFSIGCAFIKACLLSW